MPSKVRTLSHPQHAAISSRHAATASPARVYHLQVITIAPSHHRLTASSPYQSLPSRHLTRHRQGTPIGFRAWGANRLSVVSMVTDHRAGIKFLRTLTYGSPETAEGARATLILNFLVVSTLAAGAVMSAVSWAKFWWHAHLQVRRV
jgi:hypothetical protein